MSDPRDLDGHRPSASARRRAEAAGLDLDALKRSDPLQYMMLNAAPLLSAAPELLALASAALQAELPDHPVFEHPADGRVRLLLFPPPTAAELERVDARLGELVAAPEPSRRHAYYRVVRDRRGERRELALPTAPAAWSGEVTLVGPFADEAVADAWGRERVRGRGRLVYDPVPYAGAWFCDVFPGEEG